MYKYRHVHVENVFYCVYCLQPFVWRLAWNTTASWMVRCVCVRLCVYVCVCTFRLMNTFLMVAFSSVTNTLFQLSTHLWFSSNYLSLSMKCCPEGIQTLIVCARYLAPSQSAATSEPRQPTVNFDPHLGRIDKTSENM